VFQRRFPEVYCKYDGALNFLLSETAKRGSFLERHFGVFASVCINTGRVVLIEHEDSNDWVGGACGVVAAGSFNWKTCARLCIRIGSDILEFVLPPGIPIFFPSAIFRHFNTSISDPMALRTSLVYWTGAAIFQWCDLGGRRVSDLSPIEKIQYLLDFKKKYDSWVSQFSIVDL